MAAGDPGTRKRNYSATAIETTLVNSITSAATGDTTTSVAVVSVSGFPSAPFTLILQPDTNKEEVVTVTTVVGTTLTITRGQDLTQAVSHAAGSTVRHGISAREFKELQTHISARGYDTDSSILSGVDTHVHGIVTGEGDVVGTAKAQTLSNKTFSGSFTASAATFVSPTITSPTISGTPVITGLTSVGISSSQATPKSYVDAILGSATSAATSATSASNSAIAAATSASSASNSAANALTSANSATTSAASALTSQSAAATSAGSASTSATTAQAWATQLVTPVSGTDYSAKYNANLAATSAGAAATSASAAATSATSASGYSSTASGYATTASNSAAAAATSATSASNSAIAAATSATSASASYVSIVDQTGKGLVRDMGSIADTDTTTDTYISITTQVTQATAQATAAATSATSAATSATSAAASVTSATAQATAATTSATSAANSATAATTSATSAANSATAATTSAASAATSASSAATSASTAAAAAAAAVSGKLDLAGGTMTGNLILNADPTNALGAVTKQYADAITAAINFHAPVSRATTATLTGTYSNGSTSGVGATFTLTATGRLALDGGNVSTNDRVLLKNQTTDLQNGIYVVTNQGSGGVSAILTRATDYDTPNEVKNGDVVFCSLGTANAGVTFVNSMTASPTVIGTSSITFSTYTSAALPSQTGNAGYFLTTDGTVPSWASLADWGTV
jgi:hypothetical protein